mmetsp:Transcript_8184/g.11801  ORF Transcript_8184/g.11801 Transcript_8184/m.11801 type:complete len:272 (+) Transcript_8184:49-864(+)
MTTVTSNTTNDDVEDIFDVFGDYSSSEEDGDDDNDNGNNIPTGSSQATLDAIARLTLQQKARDDAKRDDEKRPKLWRMIDSKELDGGKGLEAIVNIGKGTEINRESPIIRCPNGHEASSKREAIELHKAYVTKKFHQCTPDQQRTMMALFSLDKYNDEDGNVTQYGIYQTNSVKLTGSNASEGGVFPIMCRMNHSCDPNVQHHWDEQLELLFLFATRDIQKGDELYCSYGQFHAHQATQERRDHLMSNFGFHCLCEKCKLGDKEQVASDLK